MGINICLYDEHSNEHPEWDSVRMSGDRDFVAMLGKELSTVRKNVGTTFEPDYVDRPADFAAWRAKLAGREWPNPGRLEHLVDLLERDTRFWISISF